MANYQIQRGTYDAFDDDALNFDKLANLLSGIVSLYGYNPIHTPMYEQTELFARSAGESSDIVTKEMFNFIDKGGKPLDYQLRCPNRGRRLCRSRVRP